MFVGTLLPFAVCKGFLYHLIAMLKCFSKCIAQSKSIFKHFSPHYVKIIQNQPRFFIATRVRNVAKVLRQTCAMIKRGRIEEETIFLSLGEKLSVNIFILHILSRSSTFLLSCLCNFWKAPLPPNNVKRNWNHSDCR